jgi:NodT family efflux transporter outer membrane factor (OMF) lipoprotein
MLAVLPAVLAGCAARVAPPPDSTIQLPEHWRTAIGPGGAGQPIEREWWQAFGDPALSATVASALAHNGDLRTAQARIGEFRARLAAANSSLQPSVNASLGGSRSRALSATGVPYVSNGLSAELQASYELDVWGRLGALSDAAVASFRAEQANADAVALSIAATAATGYLNLRGLDAQLELARATLELREQSRRLAQRQFDVGYSSRLEMLQAESEYRSTAETIPQLERSIFEQENALAILTGVNPATTARGRALSELSPPAVPPGLPSELLRRRPDIYRAEQNLVALNASLAAARDQLLPSFRLTASGQGVAPSFSELIHSPTSLWTLGAGIAAPLFDAGRLQAQTDVAAAQRNEAIFAYETAVRAAFSETENALGAVFQLNRQEDDTQARRDAAAETLRIAHNRYTNGYASYLEELDAQRTLFSAELSLLQLKTRILTASVDLYRAMGGGWSGIGAISEAK